MNTVPPLSKSRDVQSKAPPWLQAHYAAKRRRTVQLVQSTVDQLVAQNEPVTLEAICRLSRELDPTGKGVQKAGILGNPEAHTYYQEHSRSYQTYQRRARHHARRTTTSGQPRPIRLETNRDVDRVRHRYLALPKAELVERLLAVEQTYVETRDQLAHLQFTLVELQRATPNRPSSRKPPPPRQREHRHGHRSLEAHAPKESNT